MNLVQGMRIQRPFRLTLPSYGSIEVTLLFRHRPGEGREAQPTGDKAN